MAQNDLMRETKQSAKLHEIARDVSPLGVHGNGRWYDPLPLYFSRGAGARLWDVDGNEYIDLHGGLGPYVLGYNHPEVLTAAIETLTHQGRSPPVPGDRRSCAVRRESGTLRRRWQRSLLSRDPPGPRLHRS
jgi:4-aminobutyrate aminotransferase-like enzyme